MNTALLIQYGVPLVIAVVSTLVGHWIGKRSGRAVKPANPVASKLHGLLADPVVQAVLSKLVQSAHDSGHAALDGAVSKLLPGLAPALPMVNQVVDNLEAKLVK